VIWATLNLLIFSLALLTLVRAGQYEFAIVLSLAAIFCVLAVVPQHKRDLKAMRTNQHTTMLVVYGVIAVSFAILMHLLKIEQISSEWNVNWSDVGGLLIEKKERLLALCTLIGLSGLVAGLKDGVRT